MSRADLFRRLLRPLGMEVLRDRQYRRLLNQVRVFRELANLTPRTKADPPRVTGVVFSRDRALQMYALLESYFHQVADPAPLVTLYTSSSDAHEAAYREVQSAYADRDVTWRRESCFRDDLLATLKTLDSDRVFFLVDDIVFIRPVNFKQLARLPHRSYTPSLRMGEGHNRNYTKQRRQALPPFVSAPDIDQDHFRAWHWGEGELDWGYALSVDGHVFSLDEIRIMTRVASYMAPNTYERALQQFRDLFDRRLGICYRQARIVNLPINKVQTENDNIAGEMTPDELLERWQAREKMDVTALYDVNTTSAHQALPVSFVRR